MTARSRTFRFITVEEETLANLRSVGVSCHSTASRGNLVSRHHALAVALLVWLQQVATPAAAEPIPAGAGIATVSSIDGRIEVFVAAVPPSGGVYHSWQQVRHDADPANTGTWAPWQSWPVVPDPAGQIVATRDATGRIVTAWISGGSIWYVRQEAPNGGAFTAPTRIDTHGLHSLTTATTKDGRIEFFALSATGAAWSVHQTQAGSWAWASYLIGGTNLQAIAPAPYLDGRLALAALGSDGRAYVTTQRIPGGAWGSWTGLEGANLTQIATAANADGRLNIAAIGGDGAFYERSQDRVGEDVYGAWSQWRFRAAGPFLGPLKLQANQDGRLEAFMRRPGRVLTHVWQVAPNGSWADAAADFPGNLGDSFDVTLLTDGRLVLMGRREWLPATPGGHPLTSLSAFPQQVANGPWRQSQPPDDLFQAPPPPSVASIDEFKGVPDYVDLGSPAKLYWTVSSKGSCVLADLTIVHAGFGVPEVVLLHQPIPTSVPPIEVYPADSTPVRYVLSVGCKGMLNSLTSRETKIAFGRGPAPAAPRPLLYGPTFEPPQVREKKPFTVKWALQNIGTAELASFDVDLYVDNVKEGETKTVDTLAAGKLTSLSWNVTRELTGSPHSVELRVGNNSLSYGQFQVLP